MDWRTALPFVTRAAHPCDNQHNRMPAPLLHLQQSLNMLQGETKPIRRLVEARFDEIKAITEGGRPLLSAETSSW